MNGHDIKAATQKSVRRAIGVVPQDTVMFNDTVLHNVRYGRMDATMQEVKVLWCFEELSRAQRFVLMFRRRGGSIFPVGLLFRGMCSGVSSTVRNRREADENRRTCPSHTICNLNGVGYPSFFRLPSALGA